MRTRFGRVLESLAFQGLLFATLIIVAAFFVIKPDIHGHFSDDTGSQAHEKPQHGEQDKVFFGLSPEGWTAVGTFGLFGATIALFVATYALFDTAARESDKAEEALEVARISAEASKASADVARDTLVASHRAWIKVNALAPGILSYWEGKARMIASIVIENTGNAPATFVTFHAAIITAEPSEAFKTDQIIAEHERLCHLWKTERHPVALTVFPQEYHPNVQRITQGVPGESIEIVRKTKSGTGIFFFFAGCVNYRFPSHGEVIHQTPFIRSIEMMTLAGRLVPVGEDMNPDILRFEMPNFLGGAQPD